MVNCTKESTHFHPLSCLLAMVSGVGAWKASVCTLGDQGLNDKS